MTLHEAVEPMTLATEAIDLAEAIVTEAIEIRHANKQLLSDIEKQLLNIKKQVADLEIELKIEKKVNKELLSKVETLTEALTEARCKNSADALDCHQSSAKYTVESSEKQTQTFRRSYTQE